MGTQYFELDVRWTFGARGTGKGHDHFVDIDAQGPYFHKSPLILV